MIVKGCAALPASQTTSYREPSSLRHKGRGCPVRFSGAGSARAATGSPVETDGLSPE